MSASIQYRVGQLQGPIYSFTRERMPETERIMSNHSNQLKDAPTVSGMLDERSLQVRRLVLRALAAADKGHVGSALSLIEIMVVLYDHIVRHDPTRPAWPQRDRVILSKGHGCL